MADFELEFTGALPAAADARFVGSGAGRSGPVRRPWPCARAESPSEIFDPCWREIEWLASRRGPQSPRCRPWRLRLPRNALLSRRARARRSARAPRPLANASQARLNELTPAVERTLREVEWAQSGLRWSSVRLPLNAVSRSFEALHLDQQVEALSFESLLVLRDPGVGFGEEQGLFVQFLLLVRVEGARLLLDGAEVIVAK
jgi:hypothetical protein